ncbi:MAG: amidohydrolase [Proteobacteria bacterium]|nr:amidohydrolase [Pseudomonadota bacterium]MCP4916306.1 amidohydrolase [Pseudomonadota bacterium]
MHPNAPVPCACAGFLDAGPLPLVQDLEGARVHPDLPSVVDAHVHLFPDPVFQALWSWFERYGWPVRYPLPSPKVIEFLLSRGVEHLVALHYAHKPGMARGLNRYVAGLAAREPRLIGLATVLPGEPGAAEVLREGFELGLAGVKLHCHVQCFAPDEPVMAELYEVCVEYDRPMVIHAGREPRSPAYKVDTWSVSGVGRVENVLRDFPALTLCVPHLGADEFAEFAALMGRYDGLWLDTTMALAGFLTAGVPTEALRACPERVIYGSDFPNLPYAWDRELGVIRGLELPDDELEMVLGGGAKRLYGIVES